MPLGKNRRLTVQSEALERGAKFYARPLCSENRQVIASQQMIAIGHEPPRSGSGVHK
jgi:hypothetical protein